MAVFIERVAVCRVVAVEARESFLANVTRAAIIASRTTVMKPIPALKAKLYVIEC